MVGKNGVEFVPIIGKNDMKIAEKYGKWIKTSEKLPSKHGFYLCYSFDISIASYDILYFGRGYELGKRNPKVGFYEYSSEYGDIGCRPLYWMPLPDAPEEESQ